MILFKIIIDLEESSKSVILSIFIHSQSKFISDFISLSFSLKT